ncbi:MAG: prolyl oligopeptidase family serine peptidase [Candidatus Coatesbacteria bacterium]
MATWSYPPARRGDVVDTHHGTPVADPYRWLEEPEAPETQAFVEAQNRLTREFLDAGDLKGRLAERMKKMLDYPRYSLPFRRGRRFFFHKNDGLQHHYVLYVQDTLDALPRVVFDPNLLSPDGTVSASAHLSHDGTLFACGISTSGSDMQEFRVRRVDTDEYLPDHLVHCKFTGIAWRHDNFGFFYNRYPSMTGADTADEHLHNKVYWHALGDPQSRDRIVFEDPGQPERMFGPMITEDGEYLLLWVSRGTDPQNGIYYRPASGNGDFVRLLDGFDAGYQFVDNVGPVFYFKTDLGAPRGRVIAIDLRTPARESWREIVPEQPDTLEDVNLAGGVLTLVYLHDAHSVVRVFTLDGVPVREIALPGLGSAWGFGGRQKDKEVFFSFESHIQPPTQYRLEIATGAVTHFRSSEVDFDPAPYEVRQEFATSKDGTRIPLYLVHRRGLVLDGSHPVNLYGYGGFQVNLTPGFLGMSVAWLEHGGVYAVANLRGGCEYGEDWHRAGMLEKKQNVFDDFIACGEWLVAHHVTSPRRLGIEGGSNGGLLVAACLTQRPDLFGAVVCAVPLTDMLRYHRFTVGRYWTGEYGSADASPEQFRVLHAYSPLHRVVPGTAYPAILITSADTDDRVVASHAKKFAAALQAADTGPGPILLRVETKAGHGGGKPTWKRIEEQADIYTFLLKTLGS